MKLWNKKGEDKSWRKKSMSSRRITLGSYQNFLRIMKQLESSWCSRLRKMSNERWKDTKEGLLLKAISNTWSWLWWSVCIGCSYGINLSSCLFSSSNGVENFSTWCQIGHPKWLSWGRCLCWTTNEFFRHREKEKVLKLKRHCMAS